MFFIIRRVENSNYLTLHESFLPFCHNHYYNSTNLQNVYKKSIVPIISVCHINSVSYLEYVTLLFKTIKNGGYQ